MAVLCYTCSSLCCFPAVYANYANMSVVNKRAENGRNTYTSAPRLPPVCQPSMQTLIRASAQGTGLPGLRVTTQFCLQWIALECQPTRHESKVLKAAYNMTACPQQPKAEASVPILASRFSKLARYSWERASSAGQRRPGSNASSLPNRCTAASPALPKCLQKADGHHVA